MKVVYIGQTEIGVNVPGQPREVVTLRRHPHGNLSLALYGGRVLAHIHGDLTEADHRLLDDVMDAQQLTPWQFNNLMEAPR